MQKHRIFGTFTLTMAAFLMALALLVGGGADLADIPEAEAGQYLISTYTYSASCSGTNDREFAKMNIRNDSGALGHVWVVFSGTGGRTTAHYPVADGETKTIAMVAQESGASYGTITSGSAYSEEDDDFTRTSASNWCIQGDPDGDVKFGLSSVDRTGLDGGSEGWWFNNAGQPALALMGLEETNEWSWSSLELNPNNKVQIITSSWMYYRYDGSGNITWGHEARLYADEAAQSPHADFMPGTFVVTATTQTLNTMDPDNDFTWPPTCQNGIGESTELLPPAEQNGQKMWQGICGGYVHEENEFKTWIGNNTGKIYVIFNEPNAPYWSETQDLTYATTYAYVYDYYYDLIKGEDSTATVVWAGIEPHWWASGTPQNNQDDPFGSNWLEQSTKAYYDSCLRCPNDSCAGCSNRKADTPGVPVHVYEDEASTCAAAKTEWQEWRDKVITASNTIDGVYDDGYVEDNEVYLTETGMRGDSVATWPCGDACKAQRDSISQQAKWLNDNYSTYNIDNFIFLFTWDWEFASGYLTLGNGGDYDPWIYNNTTPAAYGWSNGAAGTYYTDCNNHPW